MAVTTPAETAVVPPEAAAPAVRLDWASALKDAGLAALVSFLLCIPIVAFRTDQNQANELILRPRWDVVFFLTTLVFVLSCANRLRLARSEREGGYDPKTKASIVLGIPVAIFLFYFVLSFVLSALAILGLTTFAPFANVLSGLGFAARQLATGSFGATLAHQAIVLPLFALVVFSFQAYAWPAVAELIGRRALSTSPRQATETVRGYPSAFQHVGRLGLPLFLGIALTFPLLAYLTTGGLTESRYWVDLGILILTYVMLGWGLNIVVGLAGLLDLGYVAFYAVGAYSYALLSTTFGLSFWICLPLAGILAAFWGIILGFPVLRLRGDYLAIVTLAFGEIIRLVLINWVDFSGGAAGISSIPRASFFGLPFTAGEGGFAEFFGLTFHPMHRIIFLYYLILALALLTNFVTMRLRKLPVGRAWEALREDEIACRSLGINTTNTKLTAFAIGAMFGGFAGSFFAVRQGFVSPESFNFLESAIILAIVVLGGMGSQFGVAIAAVAMVGGPEILRNLGFLKEVFGEGFDPNEYRLLLFGLAMVAMMIWRPRGLISEREPSIVLKERRAISGSFVKEGHG